MKKFLKSLLYSVLVAVAIFTIGLIVALFLPEGSKSSWVSNVVSYGVTLVITLFLLYWAFIVSFKVLKILFPNIVPYVLNVSRKHLFILLLVCAGAFLIQNYVNYVLKRPKTLIFDECLERGGRVRSSPCV